MTRRILIIDGHPDPAPGHLVHGLADAYQTAAEQAGHQATRINVADLDFTLLRRAEDFRDNAPPPDIRKTMNALESANHVVLLYPLWLGTLPALTKGFLEQLLRPGFAFDDQAGGWPKGRLSGRSVRVVVTMGAPGWVYRWLFGAHSLKSLERNILKFVGLGPVRKTVLGLVDNAEARQRETWLEQMRDLGRAGR